MTDNLPEPPTYFPSNVKLNQDGYLDFDKVLDRSLVPLGLNKFMSLSKQENTIILDIRNQNVFKNGFIPGSVFIGLNGGFAPWVGAILKDISIKILLVCEDGQAKEAIMRLSRVGFDNCLGYLEGGFNIWGNSGNPIDTIESINAKEFENSINDKINILDVRKVGERNNGYLKNSDHLPLALIDSENKSLNKSLKYYIHCAGGYRSMIACSILKKNGFDNTIDIEGGFGSISNDTSIEILQN